MKKDLRIIYMGTPEFAVPALELLVTQGWNVVAVITAPDKPQGRGKKLGSSPVKLSAEQMGIPVLQPANLKSPDFLEILSSFKADVQVVVAFRMLPEVVWNMPKKGTFNLHASLLPDYRGAAPINWVLINGERETGVTTFFLKHEIDTGSIIFQEKVTILQEDNVGILYERLMQKGSHLVLKTIEALATDSIVPQLQDESKSIHHAPKIFKETCQIDWSNSAMEIHNLVRGLSPYPAAWTTLDGKMCKIYATAVLDNTSNEEVGAFITDNKSFLHFQTGTALLSVLSLQLEGKKRMDIAEFLRGYALK